MAHPCFECGSECYCHGSWDDIIVDQTPPNCDGCGCEDLLEQERDFDDEYDDDDIEEDF